jgi:hypothetical protein
MPDDRPWTRTFDKRYQLPKHSDMCEDHCFSVSHEPTIDCWAADFSLNPKPVDLFIKEQHDASDPRLYQSQWTWPYFFGDDEPSTPADRRSLSPQRRSSSLKKRSTDQRLESALKADAASAPRESDRWQLPDTTGAPPPLRAQATAAQSPDCEGPLSIGAAREQATEERLVLKTEHLQSLAADKLALARGRAAVLRSRERGSPRAEASAPPALRLPPHNASLGCPAGRAARLCAHGRRPAQCRPCGGSAFCGPHGRRRATCRLCGGSGVCAAHGRLRATCRPCGGSQICEHGRVRPQCRYRRALLGRLES